MVHENEYRTIPNFEDYEITIVGNIRRKPKKHISSKGITPSLTSKGYHRIGLQVNGKYKYKGIHNLVALTFIPNPNNYSDVNHKDGNKLNNHIDNLEWCDKAYNARYNKVLGINPKGEKVGTSKLTSAEVREIYECLKVGIKSSIIAKAYNVCPATIHSIGNNTRWNSLELPALIINPSAIDYDKIIAAEELLNQNISVNEISRVIKSCPKTINKIKNGQYENYKTCYRRFILKGV